MINAWRMYVHMYKKNVWKIHNVINSKIIKESSYQSCGRCKNQPQPFFLLIRIFHVKFHNSLIMCQLLAKSKLMCDSNINKKYDLVNRKPKFVILSHIFCYFKDIQIGISNFIIFLNGSLKVQFPDYLFVLNIWYI